MTVENPKLISGTDEAGGRQVIAVSAPQQGVLQSLIVQLSPEVCLSQGGNVLDVFARPE